MKSADAEALADKSVAIWLLKGERMKWKTEKSEYLINDRWIKVRADRCIMPNGEIVEPYYVVEYPDWINVVGVTDKNEVVLVKTYRHGIGRELVELPSGIIDKTDSSPMETAKREMLEETGYTSDDFIQTGIVSANPSNHTNLTYCFFAKNLKKVADQKLDKTEEIEVILAPLDKVFEMLKNGEFLQALHVSSLHYAMDYLKAKNA